MSTPQLQARGLIERGYARQQAGDDDAAAGLYQQALTWVPNHPVAHQLLGLIAYRRRELQAAKTLMTRSLQAMPAQPHVWINLANVLEDLGEPDEAIRCLDKALQQQRDHLDSHYNRVRLLLASGQFQLAHAGLAPLRKRPSPWPASQWLLMAQVEEAMGGVEAGLACLGRGLVELPHEAQLHHNHAVLLQRLNRHRESQAGHERALALGLNKADARYNHANTLQSLGRLKDAQAALRQALALEPFHELSLYDLARLQWRMAEPDWNLELARAAAACEESGDRGRAARLHATHAQLLWRAGDFAGALVAYEAANRLEPSSPHLDGVARCTMRIGRLEEGLALHRRAVSLQAGSAALQASLATSLIYAGRLPEAEGPAAEAARLAPDDQYTWALLSLVWRRVALSRAQSLLDVGALVQVIDLEPPEGHATMEGFCAQLVRELHGLHHDAQAPIDQTLRGGTQTLGNLFDQGHPLVTQVQGRIAEAIDGYVARLAPDVDHPLRRRSTGRWRFSDSWSSRLASRGHHTNHVHPHGWISAAFYVEVPAACEDVTQQQGWLQLGQPDQDVSTAFEPLMQVQPRAGRLVLFPSYLWHGTRPFASNETRTTIAFDVLPV